MRRIFYALATGIWEDAAYANYVSIVEHGNNRMVGWLEGLEGLCSLFFAIPLGTLADRWRRDRVLRISSCIELSARPAGAGRAPPRGQQRNVSVLPACGIRHGGSIHTASVLTRYRSAYRSSIKI